MRWLSDGIFAGLPPAVIFLLIQPLLNMQSPIKPLSPRVIRLAKITRWVGVVVFIGLMVLMVMLSDTLYLQREGPDGKVYARVEIRNDLNGFASILKGNGIFREHVHEITVFYSNRLGAWSTRDKDLERIGGRSLEMMREEGSISIDGDRLIFSTDGNANSETATAFIGFPDRKRLVTSMEYFSSAFDQTFDLEWETRERR